MHVTRRLLNPKTRVRRVEEGTELFVFHAIRSFYANVIQNVPWFMVFDRASAREQIGASLLFVTIHRCSRAKAHMLPPCYHEIIDPPMPR